MNKHTQIKRREKGLNNSIYEEIKGLKKGEFIRKFLYVKGHPCRTIHRTFKTNNCYKRVKRI